MSNNLDQSNQNTSSTTEEILVDVVEEGDTIHPVLSDGDKQRKYNGILYKNSRIEAAYEIIPAQDVYDFNKDLIDKMQLLPPATPDQQRIIKRFYVSGKKKRNLVDQNYKTFMKEDLMKLTPEQVHTFFPSLKKKYNLFMNGDALIKSDELLFNLNNARYLQLKALWGCLSAEYDMSGITKLQKFYENTLDLAIEDPSSRAGTMIGVMVYDKDNIKQLTELAQSQVSKDQEFLEFQIRKGLFREQANFVFDPNRFKCICGARSIAKTDAIGAMIAVAALKEGDIIYINESSEKATAQIKDVMIKYCERSGNMPSKVTEPIEWPTGARLFFFGGGNKLSPEKLRGYNRCRLIVFDESSLQPHLRDSYAIALPNLDYYAPEGSTIVFSGNPPPVPGTLFEELWDESDKPKKNDYDIRFKRYTWPRWENPYLSDPVATMESFKAKYGDGPRYKREMLGLMGAYDTEARVLNNIKYLTNPSQSYDRITIGLDYGGTGKCAIISLGWNAHSKIAEVIYEFLDTVDNASTLITLLTNAYNHALTRTKGTVVIKSDTDNQLITNDLRMNHNIPAYKCSKMKVDKQWSLEKVSECVSQGLILIPKAGKIDWEAERTIWKRDEATGTITHIIDDKIGLHPDAIMALEYAALDYFQDVGFLNPIDDDFKRTPTIQSKKILDQMGIDMKTDQSDTVYESTEYKL